MRLLRAFLTGLALIGGSATFAAVPIQVAASRPAFEDTYTITATFQLARPFDIADMTDDFQDARVVAQDADSCTVEITSYPLFRPAIGENRNWRADYAGMTEYLRATPTENWDDAMRRDLLTELRAAGIDPDALSDRALVEQVSRWAMKRAKSISEFAIWTLHYPAGGPAVYPPLRQVFDRLKEKAARSDEQMIQQEALGRSMYYQKVHGSCTSTSVYLSTILRALGIPTRIVFCIPPFDPNDAEQARMFYRAINHHGVRETVRTALDGLSGFVNHLFNEAYVGHRWVRLNYANLGQPILDAHYFGLLTHIYTSADLSQAPLAETWGMRYFRYRDATPKLSSVNPYQLLSVRDHFGTRSTIANPDVPVAELRTATIVSLLRTDATSFPRWVDRAQFNPQRVDFFMAYQEWIAGSHLQMRAFEKRVGNDFLLVAPGHPEVKARLAGFRLSAGNGSFQAFGVKILPEEKSKVVPGAAYALRPLNTNARYAWRLAPDLSPIVLQDASPPGR